MESGGLDNQNTRRDNEHTARTYASARVNVYATGPAERAQTQIVVVVVVVIVAHDTDIRTLHTFEPCMCVCVQYSFCVM